MERQGFVLEGLAPAAAQAAGAVVVVVVVKATAVPPSMYMTAAPPRSGQEVKTRPRRYLEEATFIAHAPKREHSQQK